MLLTGQGFGGWYLLTRRGLSHKHSAQMTTSAVFSVVLLPRKGRDASHQFHTRMLTCTSTSAVPHARVNVERGFGQRWSDFCGAPVTMVVTSAYAGGLPPLCRAAAAIALESRGQGRVQSLPAPAPGPCPGRPARMLQSLELESRAPGNLGEWALPGVTVRAVKPLHFQRGCLLFLINSDFYYSLLFQKRLES